MKRVWPVVKKETNEIKRDPFGLALMILLPLIMLLVFAYAFNFDVTNLQLAVLDQDRSAESREYVQGYLNTGHFQIRDYAGSYEEIYRMMGRDLIDAALVIPPDFSGQLLRGQPARVQTIVDGSYANIAQVVVNLAEAVNEVRSGQVVNKLLLRQGKGPIREAIAPETRVWYNPSLESKNFIIPGLFGVLLMSFPPILSALAVVREKERGSIQQVMVSPIKPHEFILGKLIPYGAIAFAEMVAVLLAAVFWFKIPFQGSVILFLGVSALYVLCAVAIGLLVSTVTRTQVTAILLTLVLTMWPAMLLSGFIYPVFSMPAPMRVYSALSPVSYFVEISRAIVLKGSGLRYLWADVGWLLVYTLSFLAIAVNRFRKKVG